MENKELQGKSPKLILYEIKGFPKYLLDQFGNVRSFKRIDHLGKVIPWRKFKGKYYVQLSLPKKGRLHRTEKQIQHLARDSKPMVYNTLTWRKNDDQRTD